MSLAIGIDVGGTEIKAALVDHTGDRLAAEKVPTPQIGGPAAVLDSLVELARALWMEAGGRRVTGVGLGIPGLLDRKLGIARFSPNFPDWRNVHLVAPVAAALDLPVAMDNDVRCHALGELHFGAGQGFSDFILVAIGTGIGSGLVLGGSLWRGEAGLAGEIGHLTVVPGGGPRCGCGNRGCLEAVCSGPAIARRAGLQDAATVFRAARNGAPEAVAVVAETAEFLGIALAAYANLLVPQRIVLGGGVMRAEDLLLAPARAAMQRRTLPIIREKVSLVTATLGEWAGAVGAAALVPGFCSETP